MASRRLRLLVGNVGVLWGISAGGALLVGSGLIACWRGACLWVDCWRGQSPQFTWVSEHEPPRLMIGGTFPSVHTFLRVELWDWPARSVLIVPSKLILCTGAAVLAVALIWGLYLRSSKRHLHGR